MKLETITYADALPARVKYTVRLTEEERTDLLGLTKAGRRAARTLQHAWILLKADEAPAGPAWTDAQIAATFAISGATIARVRRAFVEQGLAAALHRKASAVPRPRKLDGRAEAQIIALFCSAPPAGRQRWTLRLLAEQYVELVGEDAAVSYETIRRALEKKRTQAVATQGVVYSPGAERRVRLPHGRRARRISPAVCPPFPASLHGRDE